jgi:hypothetical protein
MYRYTVRCVVLHIFFIRPLPLVQLKYFSLNTVIFVLETASTDFDLKFLSLLIFLSTVLRNTALAVPDLTHI